MQIILTHKVSSFYHADAQWVNNGKWKCKYHRWRPDNLHHHEIVARLISPDFINRYAHILMKPLIKYESHVNYFCLNQEMEMFNFNIYSIGHLAQSRDTSWHYERYIIPIYCLVSKIWYHPEMRKLSQSTTDTLKHFLIITLYPGQKERWQTYTLAFQPLSVWCFQ